MPKQDVNADRAAKLVEALKQQRDQGTNYPLTVARLREIADPPATDEELFKALTKKPYADQVVVAAKKDPNSPIALAEDKATLAASPMLLEYALGKLATAESPVHAVAKVVGKTDKTLQQSFEQAINDQMASGTLPESVGKHEVKGKVLLYLKHFPPPPPPAPKQSPAAALSERLLAALTSRSEAAIPLADLVEPEVKPSLVKKAVAEEPFRSHALLLPISKTLTLAVLESKREEVLASDELLLSLLEAKTAPKKPFATLALLADALPEAQRATFIAAQGRKIDGGSLPEAVIVRPEGESRVLCLKKNLPALGVLAEKTLAALRQCREAGEYPVQLESLLRDEAPDIAAKLAGDKTFKTQVVLALPGNPASPVVLAGDEEKLVNSPLLIEFAVGLLSTPEHPLHPVNKILGKVDKGVRPTFEAALTRHIENKTLPATVTLHEEKGKPYLRLTRHPLPRDPAEVLAEKLLAGLRAARDGGSYPLPLDELVAKVDAPASDKLVKAAMALDKFQVVTAIPGAMNSLVALAGDHDRLASDPRLVEMALATLRTADNQAAPVADLGKKLAQELKPAFTAAVEKHLHEATLPAGVGCLVIKKKPHLFLLADLKATRAKGEEVSAPAPEKPKAPPIDFARMFDEAFEKVDREKGAHGLVSLVWLRQAVPVERDRFDEELNHLRRAGRYTLTAAESRQGVSPEEREAGIVEQGNLLLYVSRRQEGYTPNGEA